MNLTAAQASPIYHLSWDARDLCSRFPPQFTLPHKLGILAERCPDGAQTSGAIEVSRWAEMVPKRLDAGAANALVIEPRPGGFAYGRTPSGEVHWWMNFAAGELFQHYAGRCFAQDEIQVFEHPVLASVREALLDERRSVRVTDRGHATPFLVVGAHRRLDVSTRPRPDLGWDHSLYGRGFHKARYEIALAASVAVDPPTVSDILVIEAPAHGYGKYQRHEVELSLAAAYAGFRAGLLDAARRRPAAPGVIHTGFWGCGAYGGNHVLMTAIQLIAARLAGVARLALYEWDANGREWLAEGRALAKAIEANIPDLEFDAVVKDLLGREFRWREGDGN